MRFLPLNENRFNFAVVHPGKWKMIGLKNSRQNVSS